ncbi:DUF58 domain-containing protein [[Eubacterium] cellulosolvens]
MISRKGLILLIGSIMILILGIYFREYQLIVMAVFFLIFLMLARSKLPTGLQIMRKTSGLKVFEGDDLDMDLLIKTEDKSGKTSDFGYKLIELNDILPDKVALARDSNYKLFHFNTNKIRKVSYKIICPLRRYHTIGPLFVRISDEFRLFEHEFPIENYHQFPVHIGYRTVKNFQLRTKAFDWNLGQNLLNIQGKSSDFYSLRDYTKQDSYREINWKATARKRKLMVNTYERETLSDCTVFIDSRFICGHGRPDDNFIEHSVRLAFGLAKSIIDNNNRLSVITYGDTIRMIPPGLGRNHSAYIHALLINTEPKGFLPFYSALTYAWPYLKPKSTVVIFTPMDFDESLVGSLVYLQRMDMKIIMVTASPLIFESRAINKFTLRNKLDTELRRMRIQELSRWGVDVVAWEPKDSYDLILKKINVATGLKGST